MVTNLHHVSEGLNRITLGSGRRFPALIRNNDRLARVLWLETGEGDFQPLPYDEIRHVSRPLVPARWVH